LAVCVASKDDSTALQVLAQVRLWIHGAPCVSAYRSIIEKSRLGALHCVSLLAQVSGFMVDTGFGYPAMIEGLGKVCGEIYEIDEETLLSINALEAYYGPGDPSNLHERVETASYTDPSEVKVMT